MLFLVLFRGEGIFGMHLSPVTFGIWVIGLVVLRPSFSGGMHNLQPCCFSWIRHVF